MKKLLFILLTISLSIGFTGCSSDDDDNKPKAENTEVEKANLEREYKDLLSKISNIEKRLAKLKEEIKTAKGGRLIILQNEQSEKQNELLEYRNRVKQIERQLGK